jgi:hypothetical protein
MIRIRGLPIQKLLQLPARLKPRQANQFGRAFRRGYFSMIFNYVSTLSGAIPAACSTYPASTLNTVTPGSSININRNGYVYVWVSNGLFLICY